MAAGVSRWLLRMLGLGLLLYVGLCAVLYVFQRALIYHPQPRDPGSRAAVITLPTDAGDVRVTTRARDGARAVLYLGGNAEDVTWSLPDLEQAFPDHALYLMHYRGYGGSAGVPSEQALVSDALALFDRLQSQHPGVTVIGRSLGSGVAVQVAAQRPVEQLVLVTPYDSIEALAARQFPFVPVRWLLKDRFESWRHAPRVRAPTLVLAAEHDEVIPRSHTETLLRHFRTDTLRLEVIDGTGHNTIGSHPRYVQMLRSVADRR